MLKPTATEIFFLKQLKQQRMQNNQALKRLTDFIEKQSNQR
jgi:hypothetical protein